MCHKPGPVSINEKLRTALMRWFAKKTPHQVVGCLAAGNRSTVLSCLNCRVGNELHILVALANCPLLNPELATQIGRIGADRIDISVRHNKCVQLITNTDIATALPVNVSIDPVEKANLGWKHDVGWNVE